MDKAKEKFIEWVLGLLNPELIAELIIGFLYELAKSTANSVDDRMVEMIAKALGVDIKK